MQTCKNCQSAISDDARACLYCGEQVQKPDDARRRLWLRMRAGTLASPAAATVSAGTFATYIIASTLILAYVILGVFLRPPAALHATLPALIVTPASLDFGRVVTGDKSTRTLTVENSSGSQLHWTADTSKVSWLKLDTSWGDLGPYKQKTINATIDAHGLSPRPAPYSASISFNADTISIFVKTAVIVVAPGKLCVRPAQLDFATLEQGTPGNRFITVGDCGAQSLNWFIAPGNESWVTLSSTRGTIGPGDQQTVQVAVDTSQLTPVFTAYSTDITFSSDKGSQIVPVTVTVTSIPIPAERVPTWTIVPTNLDPSNPGCSSKGDTRICTVTVTEDASSQGKIKWSPISNLGATFNPPGGQLTPGVPQQVTISLITCQNDTFTFYGAEGENPVTIAWNCTPPCIKVDQNSLSMTVMQGQPGEPQIITFTNCGADTGNLSISPTTIDGATWLNINSVNGQPLNGPLTSNVGETVSITVTSTNLQPDTYKGTITASITTSAGTDSATVNVILTVSPCFTVNQSSLSFTFPGQQNIQEVTFTNCGTYAGDISISSSTSNGPNWLFITNNQTSGTLDAGSTDTIIVDVALSHAGPGPGTYQGTISATLTTNGIVTPAPVSVSLTVSPPLMQLSSSTLSIPTFCGTGGASITIKNIGGGTLTWTVSPPTDPSGQFIDWLTVKPVSGTNTANSSDASSQLNFNILSDPVTGGYTVTVNITPSVGPIQTVTVTDAPGGCIK